jgi:hypothetical protein
MKKHLLLAMTNPIEGRDGEFNEWYDTVAYPTYKSLPGLVPLGRFKAAEVPDMFEFQMRNEFKYLSLYLFETDDVVAYMKKLEAAFAERPEYQFSPDIDQSKFFEPIFVAIDGVNFEPLTRYEEHKR